MEGMEQKAAQRSETIEKEPRTKILLLTSDSMGEHSGEVHAVQIEADFDVKAAKEEFESQLNEEQRSAQEVVSHPLHQDFAQWLIEKGLAKPVDIVPFHESTM